MLEKLTLRHFQPHRKLTIKFDKRVTSIVGPTDTGKSAILRALRWLCLNRIGSKRYISWWSEFTSVTLHVDGHVIKRKRGKHNLYSLDGQDFKSFGTTVPEPIANLLNMSEENFQRQIDPPLWLASSPAQVGRELNRIVNLDIIDLTMENVARRKREAQSKVTSLTSVQTKLKIEVEQLAWITECRTDFIALEQLQKQRKTLASDVAFLRQSLREAREHKKQRQQTKECLEVGLSAVAYWEQGTQLQQRADDIKRCLQRLARATAQIEELRQELETEQDKLGQVKECPVCQRPIES